MKCQSCGGVLRPDAKFCGTCGAPVAIAGPDGLRCPKCGTDNRPGAKFCSRDGVSLIPPVAKAKVIPSATAQESKAAEARPSVAVTQPAKETAPNASPTPSEPSVASSRSEVTEALGDAGRSRLWLVLGAVLILAAVGGGYWFLTPRDAPSLVPGAEQASGEPVASSPPTEALPEDAVEDPPAAAAKETPSVDPSTAVQAPRVSVGDQWVAEVVDHQDAALNYRAERTVTDVGPDRIFTSVRTLGKDYVRVVEYTGEWALVATHLRSGATTSYAPVLPYLNFPLKPGKSWEARVLETDAEGNQRLHEVRARVESWETVRVPAGTFNALRVVLTDDISKDGVLVQQGEDVSWYAPEAQRTVKTEETSFDPATGERRRRTISLVEYVLRSDSQVSSATDSGSSADPRSEARIARGMPDQQAAVLEAWLARKAGLRPAVAADCGCEESLKAIRQSSWRNPDPYYVEADFNSDGHKDFAVVLIAEDCTSENWHECVASLAVFNGPWRKGMAPAFFEQVGTPRGALLYHKSDVPLLIGPWESSGSLLVADAGGYVLDGGRH